MRKDFKGTKGHPVIDIPAGHTLRASSSTSEGNPAVAGEWQPPQTCADIWHFKTALNKKAYCRFCGSQCRSLVQRCAVHIFCSFFRRALCMFLNYRDTLYIWSQRDTHQKISYKTPVLSVTFCLKAHCKARGSAWKRQEACLASVKPPAQSPASQTWWPIPVVPALED